MEGVFNFEGNNGPSNIFNYLVLGKKQCFAIHCSIKLTNCLLMKIFIICIFSYGMSVNAVENTAIAAKRFLK